MSTPDPTRQPQRSDSQARRIARAARAALDDHEVRVLIRKIRARRAEFAPGSAAYARSAVYLAELATPADAYLAASPTRRAELPPRLVGTPRSAAAERPMTLYDSW